MLDLATINASQDSSIAIANRNWHIVVESYTGYKDLEFYCTKSDFVEQLCKKFGEYKNNRKLVTYIRHDNA